MNFITDLAISGFEFLGTVVGVFALLVLAIYSVRIWNKTKSRSNDNGTNFNSNKYKEIDYLKQRGSFFQYGLILSLSVVVAAFHWTTFETDNIEKDDVEVYEINDVSIIRTNFKSDKPIPIPKPPKVITTKIELTEDLDQDDFVPKEIEPVEIPETAIIKTPIAKPKPKPAPIPEAIEMEVDSKIFMIVEVMPLFAADCITESDSYKCSTKQMLEFIYSKIKYPKIASEIGIEGTVVIRFVIEKDGSVSSQEIVRDIGGGCGHEALRIVNMMGDWVPGKQRNRPVRVQFNLPVKFALQ